MVQYYPIEVVLNSKSNPMEALDLVFVVIQLNDDDNRSEIEGFQLIYPKKQNEEDEEDKKTFILPEED